MKHISTINKLYFLVFMAFFMTACATSQGEEIIDEESAGVTTETDGSGTVIEEDESITAIPIVDENMMAVE